jgi:FolB domain-containing protein
VSKDRDKVFVRGIRLEASVGVRSWEREVKQPIEVDIEVEIDNSDLIATGDLSRGADFDELIAAARGCAEGGHVDLVEALADRIAVRVLERLPVESVRVEVRKYSACALAADHVGVEVRRRRGEG